MVQPGVGLRAVQSRYEILQRITSATLPSSRMRAWGRQWMNEADATHVSGRKTKTGNPYNNTYFTSRRLARTSSR